MRGEYVCSLLYGVQRDEPPWAHLPTWIALACYRSGDAACLCYAAQDGHGNWKQYIYSPSALDIPMYSRSYVHQRHSNDAFGPVTAEPGTEITSSLADLI